MISTTKRTRLTPPVNDLKHMRFRPRARRTSSRVIIIIIHYIARGRVSTDGRSFVIVYPWGQNRRPSTPKVVRLQKPPQSPEHVTRCGVHVRMHNNPHASPSGNPMPSAFAYSPPADERHAKTVARYNDRCVNRPTGAIRNFFLENLHSYGKRFDTNRRKTNVLSYVQQYISKRDHVINGSPRVKQTAMKSVGLKIKKNYKQTDSIKTCVSSKVKINI